MIKQIFDQICNYDKESGNLNTQFFNNRIWRIAQVADYLQVTIGHIYNLVHKNKIPHKKKGKLLFFIPSEILDWVLKGNYDYGKQ